MIVAPLVRRALHANEGIALLVTERALGLEVQLGVAVAEVECAEPGAGGLGLGQPDRVGLGHERHVQLARRDRRLDGEILVAGFANQVLHRRVALGELHATGRVAESSDLRGDGARHAGRRVAVVRRVELWSVGRAFPHHDRGQRLTRRVRHRQRGCERQRAARNQQRARSTDAASQASRVSCVPLMSFA